MLPPTKCIETEINLVPRNLESQNCVAIQGNAMECDTIL